MFCLTVPGGLDTRYSCCEGVVGSPGCQVAKVRVAVQHSFSNFAKHNLLWFFFVPVLLQLCTSKKEMFRNINTPRYFNSHFSFFTMMVKNQANNLQPPPLLIYKAVTRITSET